MSRTLYLIHLDRPLAHARHYLGSTDDLVSRLSASYGRYSSYPHVDLRVAGIIGHAPGAPAVGCDQTRVHIITASSVPVGKEYETRPSLARATLVEAKPSAFAAGQVAPATVLDFLGDPAGNAEAMRPLAPMRSEHAAMVAAAGMFNGAVVGGKVMKGSTIKRTVKTIQPLSSLTSCSCATAVTAAAGTVTGGDRGNVASAMAWAASRAVSGKRGWPAFRRTSRRISAASPGR